MTVATTMAHLRHLGIGSLPPAAGAAAVPAKPANGADKPAAEKIANAKGADKPAAEKPAKGGKGGGAKEDKAKPGKGEKEEEPKTKEEKPTEIKQSLGQVSQTVNKFDASDVETTLLYFADLGYTEVFELGGELFELFELLLSV